MAIDFTYLMQPAKHYTFEMPDVRLWTEKWCKGKTLNLFAGRTMLRGIDEVRVDIDVNMRADYHEDALEFVRRWRGKFDTIVFDPPYNLRKAKEKYGGRYIGAVRKIKHELPRILNLGGRIISFGYDTIGMGRRRGFEKIAILLICHSGDREDSMAVVERFVQPGLEWEEEGEPLLQTTNCT